MREFRKPPDVRWPDGLNAALINQEVQPISGGLLSSSKSLTMRQKQDNLRNLRFSASIEDGTGAG